MLDIKGKYTTANLYAITVEDGLYQQIYDIVNSKAFGGKKVVLMPDVHIGKSGPCGLCAEIGDWVCPEHVGVDIGCTVSMMVLDRPVPTDVYADFEHKLKNSIPMGCNINQKTMFDEKEFFKFLTKGFNKYRQCWPEMLSDLPDSVTEKWVSAQLKRLHMEEGVFYKSIGSIGGGNHFIEYDEIADEYRNEFGTDNPAAVTLHFGSRNFGVKICKYWTDRTSEPISKDEIKRITNEFKEEYKKKHSDMNDFKTALNARIEQEKSKYVSGYLTGHNMRGYLMDMCFGQLYAQYNHYVTQNIIKKILQKYGIKVDRIITSVHNFIDLEDHVLRKSAIRSYCNEEILVPFNMRDGVAVCEGLSNADWLNSCAHGAGRKMSRSKAKESLTMEEFTASMEGIYSTSVNMSTIDESPMAYKDTDEIKNLIAETCKIKFMMVPKISIKAAEDIDKLKPWLKK